MNIKTYALTDTQLKNCHRHIARGIAHDVIGSDYHVDIIAAYANNSDREPFLKWARQHFVEVEINFNDHKVEVWEEQAAMTLVDLAANIGGSMGLYLGISAITVLEIVMFLLQLVTALVQKFGYKVNVSYRDVKEKREESDEVKLNGSGQDGTKCASKSKVAWASDNKKGETQS